MLTYSAVFAIPLLLAWGRPATSRGLSIGLLAYFVVLLVFIGLRYEVGPDWNAYSEMYLQSQYDDFTDMLTQREVGFFALNKLSDLLGFGLQGVMFGCALVFLIGIFAYAVQTASAWIAVAVVTPYLIFVIGMSGIRQAAAIGIIYFVLARWTRFSFITKAAMIMGAATLHTSALIAMVLLLIEDRKWLLLKIAATGLLVVYLMKSDAWVNQFSYYQETYVNDNMVSDGAVYHVLLSAIPAALYLYNRRRIAAAGWGNPQVTAGSLGALLAIPLLIVSSTGVDRLSLYLSYVQMWVYPALVATFIKTRSNWLLIISGTITLVFLGFFLYGNHASAYVPYKNVLIED
jgi:hypothetical protein